MDYSTIDLDLLRSLPVLGPGKTLQEGSGNGCSGDAPGYPTYFTRCVYDHRGDEPRHGARKVITFDGVDYVVEHAAHSFDQYAALLRRLWLPLPLSHERCQHWLLSTYRHFRHCYTDDKIVIYPVQQWQKRHYTHDPRWKDEFIDRHKAEVDAHNRELEEKLAAIARPETHTAVVQIRKFYPEHEPNLAWIDRPPEPSAGLWWETEAQQPSEEDCARVQRWCNRHPMASTYCQFCGRHYDKKETVSGPQS